MKEDKTTLSKSFQVAFTGIYEMLKSERNFQIHFIFAILAILAGFIFAISKNEMLIILLLIGIIFSAEITNTSFEILFDNFFPKASRSAEQDQTVGKIKDIMAGAVLILAIIAVIIGIWIFYPHVINLVLD